MPSTLDFRFGYEIRVVHVERFVDPAHIDRENVARLLENAHLLGAARELAALTAAP